MSAGVSLGLILSLLGLFWGYAWLGLPRPRETETNEPTRQFAAIDGLRGVLALSVFIHHAFCTRVWYLRGEWSGDGNRVFLQAGWEAVTLFFFITGFLFWTKLQRQPRLAFLAHLRSRLARLAPAYWAAVVVLLGVVAVRTGGRLQVPRSTLLRSINDWVLFTMPGLSNINGLPNTSQIIANVPWTLQLEWIFYLLVPLLGWFAGGVLRTLLFLVLVQGALGLLMIDESASFFPASIRILGMQSAYHLTRTFAGGIAVAALLPWLRRTFPAVDFKRSWFSIVSISGVLAVMLLGDPVYAFRESVPLLIPFALIVLGNDWFGFLTSPPAQLLGRISYSVYLIHGIVLHVTFLSVNHFFSVAAIPAPYYWFSIAALGAVVVVGARCWHRWFEMPFMISKKT